jgi:CRP-like cAMP-binding protein
LFHRKSAIDAPVVGFARPQLFSAGGKPEWVDARGDETMQPEPGFEQGKAKARSLAELLACPPAAAKLLNETAEVIDLSGGETVFRQGGGCRGLYVVAAGEFLRKADRRGSHVLLGHVRAGELVELAAALGDRLHTYTLQSQSSASLMLLPIDTLDQAFRMFPPLRMRLLEELAREVSRAYATCCAARLAGLRHRGRGRSGIPN